MIIGVLLLALPSGLGPRIIKAHQMGGQSATAQGTSGGTLAENGCTKGIEAVYLAK